MLCANRDKKLVFDTVNASGHVLHMVSGAVNGIKGVNGIMKCSTV